MNKQLTVRQLLLTCGILSSVLYVLMNVFVPMQWPVYSSMSQTVSELSAIGAPTRWLWFPFGAVYTLLVVAFGIGVVKSAGGTRTLRVAGQLITVYGALGVLWIFAPMHLRQDLIAGAASFTDTAHIALGVVTVAIYLAALGFASAALRGPFRVFSAATLTVVLVSGFATSWQSTGIPIDAPTPYIGLWERICIGAFLAWIVSLAVLLLRSSPAPATAPAAG